MPAPDKPLPIYGDIARRYRAVLPVALVSVKTAVNAAAVQPVAPTGRQDDCGDEDRRASRTPVVRQERRSLDPSGTADISLTQ